MSEDADKESKTEEATEQKIRNALEKGNMPFSREVPVFAGISALLIITAFIAGKVVINLTIFLRDILDAPEDWHLENGEDLGQLLTVVLQTLGDTLTPIFVIIMIIGIAASAFQNAPQIIGERIRPQASRISIAKGWQRIFGSTGRVEFLKSVMKLLAATLIVVLFFFNGDDIFTTALFTSPQSLPEFIRHNIFKLLTANVVAIIVVAGMDFAWSRILWRKNLRMTRQEVKDELKQSEGDPLLKSRLRSLGRDRARRRMIAAVPTATLIVANPTHFSVALRYDEKSDAAPVVVAKGQDLIALKIRETATKHSVPIFENVALARGLHDNVAIGQLIPAEFYKAVAELIKILNAQSRSRKIS